MPGPAFRASQGIFSEYGYDPSLSEEYLDRQRQAHQQELAQLQRSGDITAQGITDQWKAISGAVDKASSGYEHGQKLAQENAANQRRMELSEEELKKNRAEHDFLDTPLAGSEEDAQHPGETRRQLKSRLEMDKLKAETGKLTTPKVPPAITPYQQATLDAQAQAHQDSLAAHGDASQARKDAAAEKAATHKDEVNDKATTKYSEAVQHTNLPTAVTQLEHVYEMLPPKGDAPGYGRVVGMLPDALVSQKGEDLRQGISTLFNVELKDRSGTAVQDNELNRLKREFGQGSWKSADQLRKGLAQYEARLKSLIQNVDAGVDPAARSEYVNRGGRDFSQFKGRGFPGETTEGMAQAGTGKNEVSRKYSPSRKVTRVTYSDGSSEDIPDAQ